MKKHLFLLTVHWKQQVDHATQDHEHNCDEHDISPGNQGFNKYPEGDRIFVVLLSVQDDPIKKQWLKNK